MLSENDRQNLLRNLNRNRVVLVTGAGFSKGAKNAFSRELPLTNELAEALWGYLYTDPYDGRSSLKSLYSVALNNRRGVEALRNFLGTCLNAIELADWYRLIPSWFWYRIYTFNIDNVMEKIYTAAPSVSLQRVIAPDSFFERDQFLRQIQYVKLHGSLDSPKDLTFGPKDYAARAAARADIWYMHFIEDYSTHPTIFVGTELDEQLFWQYVAIRGAQVPNREKVRRPKCFLVTPVISRPNAEMLEQYNIVPVQATAAEFFLWLKEQQAILNREAVLRLTYEGMEPAIEAAERGEPTMDVARIEFFLTVFRVPSRPSDPRRSSMFLLGVPPTWDDIANDIDARRDIADDMRATLRRLYADAVPEVLHLISPAGGGKSTLLRRLALELVDDGYTVYFSDGSVRPDAKRIADHILTFSQRVFLFFDNAGDDFTILADLWDRVKTLGVCPVIVMSSRTNDRSSAVFEFGRLGAKLESVALPNLSDAEIVRIIDTLERHDLLGVLKEMSPNERQTVFARKARKQILVAMREATSGRGFDEILTDEFQTLRPDSARRLYLVNALASNDDFGLTVQQMITAMDLPPNETQLLVERNLSGILLQHEADTSKYYVRHPAIAHFIVNSAPREELAEAISALLTSLAVIMPTGSMRKQSRAFRLYRRLLSHTEMNDKFPHAPELVRSIYDAVKYLYRDDGHYWLHYGAYEVEHGNIELAENYLEQANGMLVNSKKVETALAHLLFKKAELASNSSVADGYVDEALKILRAHMAERSTVSAHALNIFGTQMENYIRRWLPENRRSVAYRDAYREMSQAIPDHMSNHPLLQHTLQSLKRAELETAIQS